MKTEEEAAPPSIYCRCGAQWHGRYVASPYIEGHRQTCGPPIAIHTFRRLGFRPVVPPSAHRRLPAHVRTTKGGLVIE
jgi:hypothetical protein